MSFPSLWWFLLFACRVLGSSGTTIHHEAPFGRLLPPVLRDGAELAGKGDETRFSGTDRLRSVQQRSMMQRNLQSTTPSTTHSRSSSSSSRRSSSSSSSSPILCNEILFEWTLAETKAAISAFLTEFLPPSDTIYASLVLADVTFGIRAQKICAACTDFPTLVANRNGSSNTGFCQTDVYGATVAHSGVVYLPLQPSETDASQLVIAPGTRIPAIYCHGTRANGEMALESLQTTPDPELFPHLMIAAIRGTLSILPDYMGYGASLGVVDKAYIVRQAYATATVPLVWRTRQLVEQETGCTTLMANAVGVSGYSEGGYASVAVAEAMHGLGFDIIKLLSGGGPYALSSTQIFVSTQRLDDNTFPLDEEYYVSLLGSAYSSTYRDLPK